MKKIISFITVFIWGFSVLLIAQTPYIDANDLYTNGGTTEEEKTEAVVSVYGIPVDYSALPYAAAGKMGLAPAVLIKDSEEIDVFFTMNLTGTEQFELRMDAPNLFIYKRGEPFSNGVNIKRVSIPTTNIFPIEGMDFTAGEYVFNFYERSAATGVADANYFIEINPLTDISKAITIEELAAYAETITEPSIQKTGHFGDENSTLVKWEIKNGLEYYFYLPYKYSLKEGDIVKLDASFLTATPYLEVYNMSYEPQLARTTFEAPADGDYYIYVSTQEQKSYSPYSFTLTVNDGNSTALTQPGADTFTITTQPKQITVSGTTETVQVYNISGQVVAQGAGVSSYSIPVAGVYIVRVGSEVRKVVVP
jgi:hypothetical protein